MFCPNCGANNEDTNLFCANCGGSLSTAGFSQPDPTDSNQYASDAYAGEETVRITDTPQQQVQQNDYRAQNSQQTPAAYSQQPYYYQPQQPAGYQQGNQLPYYGPEMGMKWYKFIIYFQLFASAVVNVLNAIRYFTGTIYGSAETASYVYLAYKGLKGFDIFFGIACIALSAYAVYTRFALSGFKKNAPMLLYCFSGATIALNLIYFLGVGIICKDMSLGFNASSLGSLVGVTVVLIINLIYFNKRKHMFVN